MQQTVPLFGDRFLLFVMLDMRKQQKKAITAHTTLVVRFCQYKCRKFKAAAASILFSPHIFYCRGCVKNSFLLRSFSWHGRTSLVARGQGVPLRYFKAALWPCDTKQTHTVWLLWSEGTNNLTASQVLSQLRASHREKWMRFSEFLKGLDWVWAGGQMWVV